MTRREAFFKQAWSDYEQLKNFERRSDVALCHKLHYLQMALEKLLKAYLSPVDGARPKKFKHQVLEEFLCVIKMSFDVQKKSTEDEFINFLRLADVTREVARKIEGLVPEGSGTQPDAEYPWQPGGGCVMSPLQYDYDEIIGADGLNGKRLCDFVAFIDRLLKCA
jgi:hypothetical protein